RAQPPRAPTTATARNRSRPKPCRQRKPSAQSPGQGSTPASPSPPSPTAKSRPVGRRGGQGSRRERQRLATYAGGEWTPVQNTSVQPRPLPLPRRGKVPSDRGVAPSFSNEPIPRRVCSAGTVGNLPVPTAIAKHLFRLVSAVYAGQMHVIFLQ